MSAPAKFNTQWRQTELYPQEAPPKARHRQGRSCGAEGGWGRAPGQLDGGGERVSRGHKGLQTGAFWEMGRWVEFPLVPTPFFHPDTFPLALK